MVEVEIDFRKTARQNAQKYFGEAKTAKHKLAAAEKALAETMKKLEEMKTGQLEIGQKPSALLKKKRARGKWYETYRWMLTTEGFLVIGGRDARQNDIIFAKRIEPTDIVLHADITGAPLTVVKSEGKQITPLAIREAAEFAAAYSSAWKAGLGGVDVYWIKPDQVSKTAPAGEFLAKGSFMIRGTKNYLKKMELKVSIGVKFEKDKEDKDRKSVV
jgi:predicted ribosome quality control (RQC) complex YloA/Tae2 family protein